MTPYLIFLVVFTSAFVLKSHHLSPIRLGHRHPDGHHLDAEILHRRIRHQQKEVWPVVLKILHAAFHYWCHRPRRRRARGTSTRCYSITRLLSQGMNTSVRIKRLFIENRGFTWRLRRRPLEFQHAYLWNLSARFYRIPVSTYSGIWFVRYL